MVLISHHIRQSATLKLTLGWGTLEAEGAGVGVRVVGLEAEGNKERE